MNSKVHTVGQSDLLEPFIEWSQKIPGMYKLHGKKMASHDAPGNDAIENNKRKILFVLCFLILKTASFYSEITQIIGNKIKVQNLDLLDHILSVLLVTW